MFNLVKLLTLALMLTCLPILAEQTAPLGIGKPATPAMIKGWDIDIRPDGLGLPKGSGSVADGEPLYEQKCALCHGSFGEGEGRWPKLAGGEDTLTDQRPEKTVGSYWPYASTLWDYIHRAMPFNAPQSLSDDEVYAITAYVLNLNDIVDDEFVLNQNNLADIEMPNKDGFIVDKRPDVTNTRCMKNCKDPKDIKLVSSLTGITPTDHFKKDGNTGEAFATNEAEHTATTNVNAVEVDELIVQTYQTACKTCHDSGLAGAPKRGDNAAWQLRLKQGKQALYRHALNGFNAMPAKGGRMDLSDELVKSTVDYLVGDSN